MTSNNCQTHIYNWNVEVKIYNCILGTKNWHKSLKFVTQIAVLAGRPRGFWRARQAPFLICNPPKTCWLMICKAGLNQKDVCTVTGMVAVTAEFFSKETFRLGRYSIFHARFKTFKFRAFLNAQLLTRLSFILTWLATRKRAKIWTSYKWHKKLNICRKGMFLLKKILL